MASDDIPLSQATATRLAQLALPARGLAVVYGLVCLALITAAYFDLHQAMDQQRNRVAYAIVMYGCFVLVFALAAVRTWQAGAALARLRHAVTGTALDAAMQHVRGMLLLFFAWMILLVGTVIFSVLQPAY